MRIYEEVRQDECKNDLREGTKVPHGKPASQQQSVQPQKDREPSLLRRGEEREEKREESVTQEKRALPSLQLEPPITLLIMWY